MGKIIYSEQGLQQILEGKSCRQYTLTFSWLVSYVRVELKPFHWPDADGARLQNADFQLTFDFTNHLRAFQCIYFL